MKRDIITIGHNAKITVPDNIKMNITQTAHFFGLYYQQTKKVIREIEKANIAQGDFSGDSIAKNSKIYPDSYGLDMIIALAFRVHTYEADDFRRWILRQTTVIQNQARQIDSYLIDIKSSFQLMKCIFK